MLRTPAVLLLALPAAFPVQEDLRFHDVTDALGLHHVQRPKTNHCLIFGEPLRCEMALMSGGFAVGDVNHDGWPDLYMTRLGARDALYLNEHGQRFVEVGARFGLDDALNSNGARFVDIDNDGDDDLIVTVIGQPGDAVNGRHRLYVNEGTQGFREDGVARGLGLPVIDGHNGWSIASGDFDRDGWTDLFITQWAFEFTTSSMLLRNRGEAAPGFFEDVTDSAGLSSLIFSAFGASFADFDDDGWQDLAIAGDFGNSLLLWNNRDGTFTDGTVAAGVGTDENGMGSAIADYDRDGDLDWFVTSIYEDTPACLTGGCGWSSSGNRLFENIGGRTFIDRTDSAGVRDADWGWGTAFLDIENDGDLDLVATNGVRFPQPLAAAFHTDRTRLWVRDDYGFVEAGLDLGVHDTSSGKGLARLDFDRDGDLDLLISRNSDQPLLLENRGRSGAWLQVTVEGSVSNREALGAKIRVVPQRGDAPFIHEVGVGSHFLAQDDIAAHFGLGPDISTIAEVRVEFPASGIVRTVRNVRANSRLHVRE